MILNPSIFVVQLVEEEEGEQEEFDEDFSGPMRGDRGRRGFGGFGMNARGGPRPLMGHSGEHWRMQGQHPPRFPFDGPNGGRGGPQMFRMRSGDNMRFGGGGGPRNMGFRGNGPPQRGFMGRPPFEGRPPFDGPRHLFDGPRPLFDGPRPPFDGPRPLFDGPRPQFDGPRPLFDGSRPPFGKRSGRPFESDESEEAFGAQFRGHDGPPLRHDDFMGSIEEEAERQRPRDIEPENPETAAQDDTPRNRKGRKSRWSSAPNDDAEKLNGGLALGVGDNNATSAGDGIDADASISGVTKDSRSSGDHVLECGGPNATLPPSGSVGLDAKKDSFDGEKNGESSVEATAGDSEPKAETV